MPISYSTPATLAATSFNSLASSTTAGASSAHRTTPTTGNLVDALVQVMITTGTITPSATTGVYVYAYASTDGTLWPDALNGTDSAVANLTPTAGNSLRFLAYIPCTASATAFDSQPLSIASAFGGVVPPRWGICIQNQSGAALAASGNSVTYTEVSY
jgi:hypothetical protein